MDQIKLLTCFDHFSNRKTFSSLPKEIQSHEQTVVGLTGATVLCVLPTFIMVLFSQINASSADLIKNGYVHDKTWRLEVKNSGGPLVFSQSALPLTTDSILATTSLTHKSKYGLMETRLTTDSAALKLAYNCPFLQGATMTATYKKKLTEHLNGHDLDLTIDVSHPKSVLTKCPQTRVTAPHVKLDYSILKQTFNFSATSHMTLNCRTSLLFGGNLEGASNLKHFGFSAGAALTQRGEENTVSMSLIGHPNAGEAFKKIVAGLSCKSTKPGVPEIGAELVYCLNENKPPCLTLAGQIPLNTGEGKEPNATVLRGKISQDFKTCLALSHKLSDKLTTVFGVEMQGGKAETMKHGLAFKLQI